MSADDSLPDDIETLKAMLIAAQAACLEAQAKASNLEAEARARALLIEQMKFTIAKLRRERFGQSSERGAVLEQLELRLSRHGGGRLRSRSGGPDGGECGGAREDRGSGLPSTQAGAPSAARASAARAHRLFSTDFLSLLRRNLAQAR